MAAQEENEVAKEAFFSRMQPFRTHPIITAWEQQVLEAQHGTRSRCTILALVGESSQGKTCKALSIFGRTQTLWVACGGYPKGVLPGVALEGRHAAILFDDIRVDQIIQNRQIFTSDRRPLPVSAVFSNHGNHQMWQHPVAIVVCSNHLPTTVTEGLSPQDAQWMQINVEKVTLDAEKLWWHKL